MSKHYLCGAKWSLKNDSFEYGGVLDENGKAELENIAFGEYTFSLSKEGYESNESKVTVDGQPINIGAKLVPLPDKEGKSKKGSRKSKSKTKKEDVVKEEKSKSKTKKTTKSKTKKEDAKKSEEDSDK